MADPIKSPQLIRIERNLLDLLGDIMTLSSFWTLVYKGTSQTFLLLLGMLKAWMLMRAVNDQRFDCNELSGLPRPDDGSVGLCVIAEINRLCGRTQGCIDTSPVR